LTAWFRPDPLGSLQRSSPDRLAGFQGAASRQRSKEEEGQGRKGERRERRKQGRDGGKGEKKGGERKVASPGVSVASLKLKKK